jgi:hypothetical protein
VRVFPETKSAHISFKLYARPSDTGRLDVEVLDQAGHRPVRVVFAGDGVYVKPESWHKVQVVVDTTAGKYDLSIDGKLITAQSAFAEAAATVERLSFRSGAFRTTPTRETDRYAGTDLPNPDTPVPLSVYNIDDVTVR